MATLLRMPEVAANSTHALLAAWSKQEGDSVAVGDCIAEIETDKAVVEFNAETAGTMGRLLANAGEQIEVGAPIGILLNPGEVTVDLGALLGTTNTPLCASIPALHAVATDFASNQKPTPHWDKKQNETTKRVFASPLARRLAEQHGVNLALLKGSAPYGRIVKRDIEVAIAIASNCKEISRTSPQSAAVEGAAYTEITHTTMRSTIARRLCESKSTIPHFYLSAVCKMSRLLALRSEINTVAARKISLNDCVIRAVALSLREVPAANVGWSEAAMRQYHQADIAVAVSTDAGLITPIIRNADRKSLAMISAEIAELATRARAGKLRPDEYQGGGFSVSNLGMYGVSEFSAIINPPQSAILAVGAVEQQPIVEDNQIKIGAVMRCTLSVDHRAIDGALAAQWLTEFKRVIEAPLVLLV